MSIFKNETTLPILITIACTLLMAGMLLYGYNTGKFSWLSDKTQKQNIVQEEKKEEEKITRTDYTEVARKTLDWIDKQRNEEGWYILERGCDFEKKTCDIVWDNKEGNKDGLIATWARLNFYEQHKDPKDLEVVKKDIDLFYNKYKDDNLKDSLWICKITYEMAQSKYLDQTQKDKLKEICFNIQFPSPKETENIRGINIKRREKFNEEADVWNTWKEYILTIRGRGLVVDFSYPTEMMNRYSWSKDSKYLSLAKEYFLVAQKQPDGIGGLEIENRCLIGISSLDIYEKGDKEIEYLDYAKNIYETNIVNAIDRRKTVTPICSLLIKRLYQQTTENEYKNELEFNSRILTELNSDNEINNRITSDNGFFKSNFGNIFIWNKNIVENGLIADLIINNIMF